MDDLARRFVIDRTQVDENYTRELRNAAWQMALEIDNAVPEGREKSLAVTKLEEALMWAYKGIAT